jgi:DNA-binding transcriptional MerR regulator
MRKKEIGSGRMFIKEFAELVEMPVSTLRHYDRSGVFHPSQHGIELENKYRFYDPMQITSIKMISVLTEIGVPLGKIKELTQDRTPIELIKLLSESKERVADEARFLHEAHTVISTFLDLMIEGISARETDISVREMPEVQIILGGENRFEEGTSFHREYIRFRKDAHEPLLNMSYPVGGYWESIEAFMASPSRPSRFFSLDPKGCEKKSAGLYVNGYARGYYGQVGDLPQRIKAFAQKNKLIFTGEVYGIYLFDEISTKDPKDYLLRISAAVKETRRSPARRPRRHL